MKRLKKLPNSLGTHNFGGKHRFLQKNKSRHKKTNVDSFNFCHFRDKENPLKLCFYICALSAKIMSFWQGHANFRPQENCKTCGVRNLQKPVTGDVFIEGSSFNFGAYCTLLKNVVPAKGFTGKNYLNCLIITPVNHFWS